MSDNQTLCVPIRYWVTIYMKNISPLRFVIRDDQHDMWKLLLTHGSTDSPLVLQDSDNDTVILKLYDVACSHITKV